MIALPQINRRRFLISTAGAGVAAGGMLPAIALAQDGTPLPAYADWKNPEDLIVHSEQTLETVRAAQGDTMTPLVELFVRNNLPPPSPEVLDDRDAWEIEFAGVATPASMTLGELKSLGVETVASVLQCSGNGRAFFEHEASGTQWSVGAAGNVL